MPQQKSHSGDKPITYRYEGCQIEVLPYFLYEVSIYESHRNRFNVLDSKMYTSNKFLKVKTRTTLRKTKEYEIVRFIDLLGAPMSFIKENNLPIYELTSKRKKKNEKGKN